MAEKDLIGGGEKDWIDTMLELYAEGRSDIEVIRSLKLTRRYFEDMLATSPKFKEIVDQGREYSESWWYEQGRTNLRNKEFVTELWKFNMANRHGWATKSEAKRESVEAVNIDKLRQELKDKFPEMAAMLGIPLDQRQVVSESIKKKH